MKSYKETIKIISLLGVCFLAGCGVDDAVSKIAKVIKDPQIQVGPAEAQPSQVSLHAYADRNANRNYSGEPAPTTLRIFALGSDHRFLNSDFFSLAADTEETLGITLIAELGEENVVPDNYAILGPYEIPKGARKLAVMAEYIDIDTTRWRDTISIKDTGTNERLLLLLLEDEIRLIRKED